MGTLCSNKNGNPRAQGSGYISVAQTIPTAKPMPQRWWVKIRARQTLLTVISLFDGFQGCISFLA
eukprot:3432048-Pyramimonas_sp.AAC.1